MRAYLSIREDRSVRGDVPRCYQLRDLEDAALKEARKILADTEPVEQSCYTVVSSDYLRPHPRLGLAGVQTRDALTDALRSFVEGR